VPHLGEFAAAHGAHAVAVSEGCCGRAGATERAETVVEAAEEPSGFRPLSALDEPISAKIDAIVRRVCGGEGAFLRPVAQERVAQLERLGLDGLPICMRSRRGDGCAPRRGSGAARGAARRAERAPRATSASARRLRSRTRRPRPPRGRRAPLRDA
jgi:hypothetical protein